jgi:hypothetical protein
MAAEMTSNKIIEVTIVINFGSESQPPIQQTITVSGGSTVFDALRRTVPVITSCKFGMDHFVEAICGVSNNFTTGGGWHFEVNGHRSNVPAERYLLKGGDWIKWLYLADP